MFKFGPENSADSKYSLNLRRRIDAFYWRIFCSWDKSKIKVIVQMILQYFRGHNEDKKNEKDDRMSFRNKINKKKIELLQALNYFKFAEACSKLYSFDYYYYYYYYYYYSFMNVNNKNLFS